MKILHITNWYPGESNPYHSSWLKKLILSLNPYFDQAIYHIEIIKGKFKFRSGTNKDGSHYVIIQLPLIIWRINEILSACLIAWVYLVKEKRTKYDILNFHIAYPNCTYLHLLKKWIRCPLVISEHWSGYHFDFNIAIPEKRIRIQRIFQQNIPVITISEALSKDIRKFSNAFFPGFIIPNIVDTNIFRYENVAPRIGEIKFLMLSQWKWPKDPFIIIELWPKIVSYFPGAVLTIGGYGEQWEAIIDLIKDTGMEDHIQPVGIMTPEKFAVELNRSLAFIHCSGYETFSVVCAEALCCGTPVIASHVGGIPEYVHSGNGMLVTENSPEAFYGSIVSFLKHKDEFNRENIAGEAIGKFSEKTVGIQYFSVIKKIIEG